MTSPKESPFQMIRVLGSGRAGEVWLAQQRTRGGISRLVAVKLLREDAGEDSDVVKRLKDEGQVLALLQHPSIVGFHEITRIDGRLALVTEYVDGTSFAPYCVAGNLLPPRVALDIAGRVASALDWALVTVNPSTGRPLNLIHRDVKPANIHLADQGEVKLLDFGLARSSEMHRHAKTRMGEIVGTPGYSAPEALAFGAQTAAGDVYSLGCTLFEALVGEPFYQGLATSKITALAYQSRDYGDFLARRLPLVQHSDLRILLEEMLTYPNEKRPKVGTVCDVCEEQIRQMDGPTFPEWNRSRVAEAAPPRPAAPPIPKVEKTAPKVEPSPQQAMGPVVVGGLIVASLGVLACGATSLAAAIYYILGV